MTAHVFGRHRPSQTSGFALQVDQSAQHRDTYFRELPAATGKPPYHLALGQILPADHLRAITEAKKLVFHLNGDMGGIKDGMPQTLVAKGMEADFDQRAQAADNPAFLYILGDCVYFNGEGKSITTSFIHPTSSTLPLSSLYLATMTARTWRMRIRSRASCATSVHRIR